MIPLHEFRADVILDIMQQHLFKGTSLKMSFHKLIIFIWISGSLVF